MGTAANWKRGWRRAVAVLATVVTAAPATAAPPGAESPQAVVERLRAALAKEDFREVAACMAPAARREMAFALVLGTTMMVAFMGMGGDLAAGMAEGMAEAAGEPMAEQKAEAEKVRAEAQKKTEDLKRKHEAILAKHGLQERLAAAEGQAESPEAGMATLLAGVDEGALIADLMGFFGELGEERQQEMVALPPAVTDYAIDGDRATARAGEETVEFVRVDGRWYFQPPAKGD